MGYFDDCSIGTRSVAEPCVKKESQAACPSCGRNDQVVTTKTLYGGPELARDGAEPIGTAAYCNCRTWYDSHTGEYVDINRAYTY